ncbi:acetylornithine deacetylase [Chthonobacter albigriseus]|uniref:acetylornithine deacetylase n=1 Tax=Chthonobacter albigriseus TaxID=1683161 RepID=UPI0015EEB5C0
MPQSAAIDILAHLVAFDTTSRNSNLDLVAWVEAFLLRHGLTGTRITDETGQKANLLVTIGPADVPGYILSGHTDVVPVDGQDWSTDPFQLTERDGRYYGRGSCDMKGFLAVCLAAVPDMLAKPLARPIHLAFSYDEEVGCVGVRPMIAHIAAGSVAPIACFVGEPTSMQPVIGHKAKRSFKVTVTGKACHSSLAPSGVNAVEYAAELILKIREIGRRLSAGSTDPLYDVPVSTAHVGTVSGGTALNIVPASCEFAFEFRTLPEENIDALVAEVMEHARAEIEPQMHAVDPATGFRFEEMSEFPGLATPEDAPVVTLAKRLAERNDHAKVAYGTEAGLFAEAGIPTVVVGPGSIGEAHKADEFITAEQLAACARFVERLIEEARA